MTNLEALRRSKGMTQKQLAIRAGCDQALISRLERRWYNKIPPTIGASLGAIFGQTWTFEALMQEVAEPSPLTGEEAPGESESDEQLRKAS